MVAFSPSGTHLVYVANDQLYVRAMDQLEAKAITGTEGAIHPFLSPDDRWIGFWADGKLKKIPVEGGVATSLCDASLIYGANWSPDNRIAFAGAEFSGISVVSSEGGKPEILTKPDPKREEFTHRLPAWLPNGKALLFTIMKHGFDPQPNLALFRLDTHQWHVVLQDAADARSHGTPCVFEARDSHGCAI